RLIASFDPEFQHRLRNRVLLAGGGSTIKGLDTAIESAMKRDLGGGKVVRVEEPIYGGSNGALKIAHDMPEEFWEQLKYPRQRVGLARLALAALHGACGAAAARLRSGGAQRGAAPPPRPLACDALPAQAWRALGAFGAGPTRIGLTRTRQARVDGGVAVPPLARH